MTVLCVIVLMSLRWFVEASVVKVVAFQPICEGATCSWPAGKSMLVAGRMMADRINAGGYLRGNHTLDFVEIDTHCSPRHGTEEAARLIGLPPSERPFGVVGCGCSGCTVGVLPALDVARIPVISNSASSTSLSDRTLYPHFFRTFPSDQPIIKTWFIMFHSFGWQKFAKFQDSVFGHLVHDYFEVLKGKFGMEDVLSSSPQAEMAAASPEEARLTFDLILNKRVRGVMAVAYDAYIRQVTCQMIRSGVRGMIVAHLGWILPSWPEDDLGSHTCTLAQMLTGANYFVSSAAIAWDPNSSSPVPCQTNLTFTVNEFSIEYNRLRLAAGLESRMESSYTADAVCMMASLFNDLWDSGTPPGQIVYMNHSTHLKAVSIMQATNFQGLSGPVRFPADGKAYGGGDRLGAFQIYQRLNGHVETIGTYDGTEITLFHDRSFQFDEGYTQNAPPHAFFPDCPNGVYDFGTATCQQCLESQSYAAAVSRCLCVPGFLTNGSTCSPCHPGTYQDHMGQSKCLPCQPGSYAPAEAGTACLHCPYGRFAETKGSTACLACRSVTHASTTQRQGASSKIECALCEPGKYSSGSDPCLQCEKGTFAPASGHTACARCPHGTGAAHEGSRSCQIKVEYVIGCVGSCILLTSALLLFSLTVGRRLVIHDIGPLGQTNVVTTVTQHWLLAYRGPVPVMLTLTSNPALQGMFNVRPISPNQLELLSEKGEALGSRVDASSGRVALFFPTDLASTGWHVPVGILAPAFAIGAGAIAIAVPVNTGDAAIISATSVAFTGSVVLYLRVWLGRWLHNYSHWTPRGRAMRTFLGRLKHGGKGSLYRKHRKERRTGPIDKGGRRAVSLQQIWEFGDFFSSFIRDRDMYYVVNQFVKPLTSHSHISYAELAGASEVEWFVSHYWGNTFAHLVETLEKHAHDQHHQTETPSLEVRGEISRFRHISSNRRLQGKYWICSMSINQWCISKELGSHWTESSFYLALRSETCVGTLMVLDDKLQPLTRSWCMFEVLQTLILHDERPDDFTGLVFGTRLGVLRSGNAPMETVMSLASRLANLRMEDASASSQADKNMIDTAVLERPGGFEEMNRFVRASMTQAVVAAKDQLEENLTGLIEHLETGNEEHTSSPGVIEI